jgi:hypothetical protein
MTIAEIYDKWCDSHWREKPLEMLKILARCPSIAARAVALTFDSVPEEHRARLVLARWRVAAGRQVAAADREKVEVLRSQLPLARVHVMRDFRKRARGSGDVWADAERLLKPAVEGALGRIIVSGAGEWVHERFFGSIRLVTMCGGGSRSSQLTWRQIAYGDNVPVLPECHFFAAVGLSGVARIDCLLPDSAEDFAAVVQALTWTIPFFEMQAQAS